MTGFIIFINKTPIKWYTKRQNTIETSTFGAELVAARIATEYTMEMKYKLRMLGVPLLKTCLLYTSPSPRDGATSRMPSSA